MRWVSNFCYRGGSSCKVGATIFKIEDNYTAEIHKEAQSFKEESVLYLKELFL